jgi:hypothetical protein
MPLARKTEGYPVNAAQAAAATVERAGVIHTDRPTSIVGQTQPSAKDRSIIRQTAWKIVGPAMANWTGSPEQWFDKCVELRAKVEKDMLDTY